MEKKKSYIRQAIEYLLYLGVMCIFAFVVVEFVGQRTEVSGQSMMNTLMDGDQLLIDKISYNFNDPQRFDIIVFPYEEDKLYIKRIIGMPGETVQIDEDGVIYINGEKLEESYGNAVILESRIGLASEPVLLGEDEYFVLGDNRNDSRDSRMEDVGNVRREEIVGKAWIRIYPFDEAGMLKP